MKKGIDPKRRFEILMEGIILLLVMLIGTPIDVTASNDYYIETNNCIEDNVPTLHKGMQEDGPIIGIRQIKLKTGDCLHFPAYAEFRVYIDSVPVCDNGYYYILDYFTLKSYGGDYDAYSLEKVTYEGDIIYLYFVEYEEPSSRGVINRKV